MIHDFRSHSIDDGSHRLEIPDVDAAVGAVAPFDVVAHRAQVLDEMAADEAADASDERAHGCGLAEVLVQVDHALGACIPRIPRGALVPLADQLGPFHRVTEQIGQRGGQGVGVAGFHKGGGIAEDLGSEPVRVVTTGVPAAIASSGAKPKPS